ncbi:MAG: hypothetical protein KAV87_31365 [Desulfobacteraceae bacterium]|nr:hypothetical protein [Desulfobacteraceae bacterium]
MSEMSNLHAQQEILDKISSSTAKKASHDAQVAIARFCNTDAEDLAKDGVTSSTIKTMKDMLEWKQMTLYAEEQKEKTDV